MRKLSFFLILFVFNFALGQKTFVPQFEVGKVYNYEITDKINMTRNGKLKQDESYLDLVSIELLEKFADYQLIEWKINKQKDYFTKGKIFPENNITSLFDFRVLLKVNMQGQVISINNVADVKDQLKSVSTLRGLTENEVKLLGKTSIGFLKMMNEDDRIATLYNYITRKIYDYFKLNGKLINTDYFQRELKCVSSDFHFKNNDTELNYSCSTANGESKDVVYNVNENGMLKLFQTKWVSKPETVILTTYKLK